uniref:Cathepsin W n=1 Tax=Catagonus wagneri TaxID=51154 RepID=A0A8C3WE64_9CETA
MALTAHLCCLLALLVAGQVQGTKDFLGSQAPGPQPMGLKETFTLFQIQYNRSYSNPAEHARRLDIFARNLAQAQRLQEEDLGTAEFGVTPFSDLSGAAAWTPPPADNIEAQWAIKHSKPGQLSVQQLLDCDRCGNGCNGGFVWDAFLTVLNNSGLASEKDYPFKGKAKTHRCLAKEYKKVAWIQDFFTLPSSEQSIARYLATEGPITVTVTASLLQQYRSGVLKGTHDNCDPESVDHSVLLVGFGRSKPVEGRRPRPRHSLPYWILKNSWGPDWGEGGYFRLHRGSNTCGITKYPVTARVDKPAEKHQISCPP